jgi:hypothetical protein
VIELVGQLRSGWSSFLQHNHRKSPNTQTQQIINTQMQQIINTQQITPILDNEKGKRFSLGGDGGAMVKNDEI